MSSFFWSSPVLLAVPAAPILDDSSISMDPDCNSSDIQIQQPRPANIHRNSLACRLDRLQQLREIAGSMWSDLVLFLQGVRGKCLGSFMESANCGDEAN